MKKVISVFLIAAMILSLPVSVSARSKISEELAAVMAKSADDDLIRIWINRQRIPTRVIDELLAAEYTGWTPGNSGSGGGGGGTGSSSGVTHEQADAYNAARRAIVEREYTNALNAFIAAHINPERQILYFGSFTGTLNIEATKAEIEMLAELDEVTNIGFYDSTLTGSSGDSGITGGGGGSTPVHDTPPPPPPREPAVPAARHEYTTADALLVLRAAAGLINFSTQQTALYDMSGDGKVTTADALTILRIAAGLEEPPEPVLPPLSVLPAEVLSQLRTDFTRFVNMLHADFYAQHDVARVRADNINIEKYLGTYNDYIAVRISYMSDDYRVGGGQLVYLLKGPQIVYIADAYEQNLISRENVMNIYHYADYVFPLPFKREAPPLQAPLSPQDELRIRESYFKRSRIADSIDMVTMFGYYGTYNGYDAVAIRAFPSLTGGGGRAGEPVYFVASYYFGVINIYLHKDGSFTDLREAFAQKLISEEDLFSIHYHWSQLTGW
jgi:hypothetical protein